MTKPHEETWEVVPTPDGMAGKEWREIRSGQRAVIRAGAFTRTSDGESEVHAGVFMSDADARFISAAPDMARVLLGWLPENGHTLECGNFTGDDARCSDECAASRAVLKKARVLP